MTMSLRRRQQQAAFTPAPAGSSTDPNYRVLSEVFGDGLVSCALRGRVVFDRTASASLDLAIGIMRTLLNEEKCSPDDIRRTTRRCRIVLMQRREQTARTAAAGSGTSPSFLVLSGIFGAGPVSRALYGRGEADVMPCSPAVNTAADDYEEEGEDTLSSREEESLDLAIGILRTLMNEKKKLKPGDVSRVASRWRRACFGNGVQHEETARGTEEHGGEASEEVCVVTDDECSTTCEKSSPSRSPIAAARKEPPRRESSVRKLNPPKKRKSAITIAATGIEGCKSVPVPAATMDAPPAA